MNCKWSFILQSKPYWFDSFRNGIISSINQTKLFLSNFHASYIIYSWLGRETKPKLWPEQKSNRWCFHYTCTLEENAMISTTVKQYLNICIFSPQFPTTSRTRLGATSSPAAAAGASTTWPTSPSSSSTRSSTATRRTPSCHLVSLTSYCDMLGIFLFL